MSSHVEAPPFVGETLQVALVTADLEATLDELSRLGLGPFSLFTLGPDNTDDLQFRGKPADFTIRFALAESGGTSWEVIQPISGSSMYREFLELGGEGFHHVAIGCRDIPYDERVAELEARGYEVVQSGTAFDGALRFADFHTDAPGAPIVEVVDFPEGFAIEDHAEGWYPAPPDDRR